MRASCAHPYLYRPSAIITPGVPDASGALLKLIAFQHLQLLTDLRRLQMSLGYLWTIVEIFRSRQFHSRFFRGTLIEGMYEDDGLFWLLILSHVILWLRHCNCRCLLVGKYLIFDVSWLFGGVSRSKPPCCQSSAADQLSDFPRRGPFSTFPRYSRTSTKHLRSGVRTLYNRFHFVPRARKFVRGCNLLRCGTHCQSFSVRLYGLVWDFSVR